MSACDCLYEPACCLSGTWRSYECPDCARERFVKMGLAEPEIEEAMSIQFAHLTTAGQVR